MTCHMSIFLILATAAALAAAQPSCSSSLTPSSYPQPSVAAGYSAHLLTVDLSRPRVVVVDDRGQLLISGSEDGIVGLVLSSDGCTVESKKVVVAGDDVGLPCCAWLHRAVLSTRPHRKTIITMAWRCRRMEKRCKSLIAVKLSAAKRRMCEDTLRPPRPPMHGPTLAPTCRSRTVGNWSPVWPPADT
jgi:hypothetical protein